MRNLSIEELRELRALCVDCTVWSSIIDELIAIRELKGDQVPVGLVDERQGSGGFCLTQCGRRLNLQHGTELFTAPQKLVVWLGDIAIHDDLHEVGALVSYDDVVAAIEAADGIVKEAE